MVHMLTCCLKKENDSYLGSNETLVFILLLESCLRYGGTYRLPRYTKLDIDPKIVIFCPLIHKMSLQLYLPIHWFCPFFLIEYKFTKFERLMD